MLLPATRRGSGNYCHLHPIMIMCVQKLHMLAETTNWQLVLLDVFMPDLCGTEIIQAQLGSLEG